MRVAFQGERGAYSEEAVIRYFGEKAEPQPRKTISMVFMSVEAGEVEAGVVPVENSIEGSVGESYDALLTTSLKVIGEINLRISHCLISLPGATIDGLRRVVSHPQALAQCRAYLASLGLETISHYDTAAAVRLVKETGDKSLAAIASARAAEIHGMEILARGIEDYGRNFTRFFVIGRGEPPRAEREKTSIIFALPHKPGALYEALGAFAKRGINLTKIESRPTRARPWQYNFYVDFEGHISEERVKDALSELAGRSILLKVLGSYPAWSDNPSDH
ncbi:MAG: prephenate dehydratase [Nitrososphaerota archaeon]|nr:prephenate dehydratase [Candidatus Calditenuaceae archaeon]MDW8072983.1 prephenate dehydratase [Nitrososphaerota archaeon]